MRGSQLVGGLACTVALLFAACGSGSDHDGPGPEPAVEAATVQARTDGLTGAPVPVPQAPAADFDAARLSPLSQTFPPLNDPKVVAASEAQWLQPDTLVLGAAQGGEARAYPLFIMQFHHIVNDTLGGEPYLVTF